MKTDELILVLSSDAGAVRPRVWQQRYALALAAGLLGASVLLVSMLGVRPDIADVARLPIFWVKLAFTAALAAGALWAAMRLSRPGVAPGGAVVAIAAPVLVIWLLGAIALAGATPEARTAMLFGNTWDACLVHVPILSMPAFIALLGVMKTLAPTRLVLAGAAAGLLAGAVGAMVYALYCPESGVPFIGIWYVIGMLVPTTLGALLGPRLLRW